MDPNREPLLQRMCGSMGTNNVSFDGPRSPTCPIVALAKGEGGVLVPHHQPILLRRLVKQGCAKGECRFTEIGTRQFDQSSIVREGANRFRPENVACSGATALDLRFFHGTKDCQGRRDRKHHEESRTLVRRLPVLLRPQSPCRRLCDLDEGSMPDWQKTQFA